MASGQKALTTFVFAKAACDRCRLRKIKCDSSSPCSNCQRAKVPCSSLSGPKKRGPKPQQTRRRATTVIGLPHSPSITIDDHSLSPTLPLPLLSPQTSEIAHNAAEPEQLTPSPANSSGTTNVACQLDDESWHRLNGAALSSIYQRLESRLREDVPQSTLSAVVDLCINRFMQYLFPLLPIVHVGSLRSNLQLLPSNLTAQSNSSSPVLEGQRQLSRSELLSIARAFTLSTALCAETALLLPAHLLPAGANLTHPFLQASRDMLDLYQEIDVGDPDSSSLVIRFFHSNCTHAAGKTRLSWYILSQAIHLAQGMRIYHEPALSGLDPIESHLRRNMFWILYVADRHVDLLSNRPSTLHEFGILPRISVSRISADAICLLSDCRIDGHTSSLDGHLSVGIGLCADLWSTAFGLLQELKFILRGSSRSLSELTEREQSSLINGYLSFVQVLDNLPPWLQDPDRLTSSDKDATETHRSRFWVQRVNLLITFHCLRLLVLQRFADCDMISLIAVSHHPAMLALRKTEIAQDMINFFQSAPFEAMQINGEPCVEKIRMVGASLLEITHMSENAQMTSRAKSQCAIILNLLTRLDSRVSSVAS